jgi:hypothetical protein
MKARKIIPREEKEFRVGDTVYLLNDHVAHFRGEAFKIKKIIISWGAKYFVFDGQKDDEFFMEHNFSKKKP